MAPFSMGKSPGVPLASVDEVLALHPELRSAD
jgi:hypothetical protein